MTFDRILTPCIPIGWWVFFAGTSPAKSQTDRGEISIRSSVLVFRLRHAIESHIHTYCEVMQYLIVKKTPSQPDDKKAASTPPYSWHSTISVYNTRDGDGEDPAASGSTRRQALDFVRNPRPGRKSESQFTMGGRWTRVSRGTGN